MDRNRDRRAAREVISLDAISISAAEVGGGFTLLSIIGIDRAVSDIRNNGKSDLTVRPGVQLVPL